MCLLHAASQFLPGRRLDILNFAFSQIFIHACMGWLEFCVPQERKFTYIGGFTHTASLYRHLHLPIHEHEH